MHVRYYSRHLVTLINDGGIFILKFHIFIFFFFLLSRWINNSTYDIHKEIRKTKYGSGAVAHDKEEKKIIYDYAQCSHTNADVTIVVFGGFSIGQLLRLAK